MKRYQGTKIVHATPAYRINKVTIVLCDDIPRSSIEDEYNTVDVEDGYQVIYEDGYKSWSPKQVFDKAYRICETEVDILNIKYESLMKEIETIQRSINELANINEIDIEMRDYYNSLINTRRCLYSLIDKLKTE